MQTSTHTRNSYSNHSFYEIEKIANDNWNDFPLLLELHSNALEARTTPYAKDLKEKLEERLKEIIFKYRRSRSILEEIELYLFFEETDFAKNLIREIDKRLGKNIANNEANQLKNKTHCKLSVNKIKPRIIQENFHWVSTEVGFSFEKMNTSGLKKCNLLSLLGYKTGNYSDLSAKTRRAILYKIYEEEIPKKFANLIDDIKDWGKPKSGLRLRKIAESIAFVVKSEKMHKYNYEDSIFERESDLADLKKKYYDGVYDG